MIIKKGCNFDCDFEGGRLSILLRGEIDHHSAVSVRSAIDEKLYELRPASLVIDLSRIEFMDSSGLGLIMGRYALMQKLGGEFALQNPNERIVKIFELAGLSRIVRIESGAKNDSEEVKNESK